MALQPSVLQLEQVFLSSWPALKSENHSGWVWRYANGFSKRANCAQVMSVGDGLNFSALISSYTDWANAHSYEPTIRVTPLAGEAEIAILNELGWVQFDNSLVMVKKLGKQETLTSKLRHSYNILDALDPLFFEPFIELNGYEKPDILRAMIKKISNIAKGILIYDASNKNVGAALLSKKNEIATITSLVIDKKFYRKNYATSIMQAAVNWAISEDAKWIALQVVAKNIPAINLYHSFGFKEIYGYYYLQEKRFLNE